MNLTAKTQRFFRSARGEGFSNTMTEAVAMESRVRFAILVSLAVTVSLLISGARLSAQTLELGAQGGVQQLFAIRVDNSNRGTNDNSFDLTAFGGVYAAYRFTLKEERNAWQVRAILSQGIIDYDLHDSRSSKGNGSSFSYYNEQRHRVSSFELQAYRDFLLRQQEHFSLGLIAGPELSYTHVRKSEGAYGEQSFEGFIEDSLGMWSAGERMESNTLIDGASPQSLNSLQLNLSAGLQGTWDIFEEIDLIMGIQGVIGLGNLIGSAGNGEASKYAVRASVGCRWEL